MGVMGESRQGEADTGRIIVAAHDLKAVFVALYPGLRRFAGAISPSDVDPDDLVQDAMVNVMVRGGLDGLINPHAYLRRAVLNVELARRRRLGQWTRIVPRVASSTVEDPVYPSDLGELRRLDATDRALLYLTAVEGWPFAEVAQVLDRSEGALRVRAFRLRRRLRDELSKGCER